MDEHLTVQTIPGDGLLTFPVKNEYLLKFHCPFTLDNKIILPLVEQDE